MYRTNHPIETELAGVLDGGASHDAPGRVAPPPVPTALIRPTADLRLAAAAAVVQAALDAGLAIDRALDQFYTDRQIARACLDVAAQHFDLPAHLWVEPSAGDGAFSGLLPPNSVAVDVDPRLPDIMIADFLSIEIESGWPTITIGNPPFGRSCELAVRFFNHAATFSRGIALVLPRTFRKASIVRRLNRHFHLIEEVMLPPDAFLFRGKPYNVPALFQVWERRTTLRKLPITETSHPHFNLVAREEARDRAKRGEAIFSIQRVGAAAGQVHHNFELKETSHIFIHGNVEGVEGTMVALRSEFAAVAANTAGNPSLALSEIVALYRERTEGVPAYWRMGVGATMIPSRCHRSA